jgi:aspartyl-tRNA(Asn)/glutamyl-tRNA(Gln) amidotransferase subunit C
VKITEKEVRYVAGLANLELTDPEVARLQSDLDGILEHMDRLNEIDTSGVEPMAQVLFESSATTSPCRRAATPPQSPTRLNPAADISRSPRSSNADPCRFHL